MAYPVAFDLPHRPILWATDTHILDRRGRSNADAFLWNHPGLYFGTAIVVFHRTLASAAPAFLLPHRLINFATESRPNRRPPLIITPGFLISVFSAGKAKTTDTAFELIYTRRVPKPIPEKTFDEKEGDIDISFIKGVNTLALLSSDLDRDPTLETAILISLLSDKRANDYEVLPEVGGSRRGWWADAVQQDQIGSKLWLLERSKLNTRTCELAEHYVLDALAWMIEDGVAIKVEAEASIISNDALGIRISIHRTTDLVYKYSYTWNKQIIGKGS